MFNVGKVVYDAENDAVSHAISIMRARAAREKYYLHFQFCSFVRLNGDEMSHHP